jgi:hypothetical protein
MGPILPDTGSQFLRPRRCASGPQPHSAAPLTDAGAIGVAALDLAGDQRQKSLNRVGLSAVYRVVCVIDTCPSAG